MVGLGFWQQQQHLIYYWPNFYQTLKVGFWDYQQQQCSNINNINNNSSNNKNNNNNNDNMNNNNNTLFITDPILSKL